MAGARPPWYGTIRELRKTLRTLGEQGYTLQDCADHYGVAYGTLYELLQKKRTVYGAYRRGLAHLKGKTRSAIAAIALREVRIDDDEDEPFEEISHKDRLVALKLLTTMLSIDKPGDVGDISAGVEVNTWAELALKVEVIEKDLDDGVRRIDPVSGKKAKKKRKDRPTYAVED